MSTMQALRSATVGVTPAYRTFGVAPGDTIEVVEAEIDRLLKEANGNRLKAINKGFEQMRANGLITDPDLKRLEKVSLTVIGVEEGKYPAKDAVAKLDKLYLEALADPQSSTMGATMIGVTYSARSNKTASLAGLMGMVVGGMLTGGPGGALVGGIVGWVAGGGCKKD
jgi:hypothetical protein